ncbi:MAG: class I SAM-dependent methyltransferase [Pseudomonadota bacterium]|nr:class I SAM-dependent methyltransferase [Pseudomonadota bacterium]
MQDPLNDKTIEKNRYDGVSRTLLEHFEVTSLEFGYSFLPLYLQPPYEAYYSNLCHYINRGARVLELGSGSGQHTEVLVDTDAKVLASDISSVSLQLLKKRFKVMRDKEIETRELDIERLPFDDNSFEVVVSAGSLSYGDNTIVMDQIFRVLKCGGHFICVDSLGNNPIYRLNRFLHFLRGKRSKNTLTNMPTLNTLSSYRERFSHVDVQFFGSCAWTGAILAKFFNEGIAHRLVSSIDEKFNFTSSAFKFVMVCRK